MEITAIITVAAIEVVNLLTLGLDGTIAAAVVGAIAGIAGYQVGHGRRPRR